MTSVSRQEGMSQFFFIILLFPFFVSFKCLIHNFEYICEAATLNALEPLMPLNVAETDIQ